MSDPTILEIQRVVSDTFKVPLIEMRSHRRSRYLVRPRQVAMWLARQLTANSLPEIGKHFGNRDHTTVLHAINMVEILGMADPDFGARVVQIRESFQPQ